MRLDPLRDAAWLDADRARAYGRVLVVAILLVATAWIGTSRHGLDVVGHPLGTDFISFWTASDLALRGQGAAVYDPAIQAAREHALFPPESKQGYTAFFYPPTYLLLCLPLALLPYFWSLAAWVAATLTLYWRGIRALLPGPSLPIFAFPAVLLTIGHGQNALLTTALFAGAACWLNRGPWLAGLCLGALCIKPHLLVLAPVTLLAGRHWRAIAGATLAAACLALLSLAVFGDGAWRGFFAISGLARATLEQGLVEPSKMVSVFAAFRLLDAPIPLAYAAQAGVAIAAALVLIRLRRNPDSTGQIAALVAATLLATPFLLDYDLTLAAVPLAYVFARARAGGFLPWEKLTLAVAFAAPILLRTFASHLLLPLGPLVDAALFAVVARRLAAG